MILTISSHNKRYLKLHNGIPITKFNSTCLFFIPTQTRHIFSPNTHHKRYVNEKSNNFTCYMVWNSPHVFYYYANAAQSPTVRSIQENENRVSRHKTKFQHQILGRMTLRILNKDLKILVTMRQVLRRKKKLKLIFSEANPRSNGLGGSTWNSILSRSY